MRDGERADPRWTGWWDLALAAALLAATVVETALATDDDVLLRILLASLAPLGLFWRRTQPALSVALVSLALASESVVTESPDQVALLLGILVSAFSVAAYAERREALLGLGLLAAAISLSISVDPSDSVSNIPPTLALFLALPAGLGFAFRRRGRDLATLAGSNEALRREAETAVEDERRRIARELHDVVSHAVTLIAVQAEAGQALLDTEPEGARRALAAIGATSRDALAELHAMLSLLREPAGSDAPAGLSRLTALVEGARAAGVGVSLTEEGSPGGLTPAVDQAAFRFVQEGLTNAMRHTLSPRVDIVLRHDTEALHLRVDSTGPTHQSSYGGTGSGLAGLRARVLALGGTFEAGPGATSGYSVVATLPRTAS
ncbi:hypothetical protein NSZ01_26320 [Nocardioides szechwanensis]|uniref:histidine kinase n=1 Tax=Nocardioides szechwanensis TaxID=1005944 RepID=A0A1H0AHQ0_9ACTN|nr:histidine kinase [Nocardioides szechwanensis]GEP34864.1 hypothetical protein NSZ01_26320 [Nocardioides szechwanensis]SDN32583.1 Signal transduction histidine kinase [Nocardioides szechwanensis]